MTGAGDSEEGFNALYAALAEADDVLPNYNCIHKQPQYCNGAMETTIEEALNAKSEMLKQKDCAGRIAAEYVWAYPPGIPLLVPGQRITEEFAAANLENCISDRGELPLLAIIK